MTLACAVVHVTFIECDDINIGMCMTLAYAVVHIRSSGNIWSPVVADPSTTHSSGSGLTSTYAHVAAMEKGDYDNQARQTARMRTMGLTGSYSVGDDGVDFCTVGLCGRKPPRKPPDA